MNGKVDLETDLFLQAFGRLKCDWYLFVDNGSAALTLQVEVNIFSCTEPIVVACPAAIRHIHCDGFAIQPLSIPAGEFSFV